MPGNNTIVGRSSRRTGTLAPYHRAQAVARLLLPSQQTTHASPCWKPAFPYPEECQLPPARSIWAALGEADRNMIGRMIRGRRRWLEWHCLLLRLMFLFVLSEDSTNGRAGALVHTVPAPHGGFCPTPYSFHDCDDGHGLLSQDSV